MLKNSRPVGSGIKVKTILKTCLKLKKVMQNEKIAFFKCDFLLLNCFLVIPSKKRKSV